MADLLAPPQTVDVETAAALWQHERIRIVCDRPPLLNDYPELSVRLRGAFGRQLRKIEAKPRRAWRRPAPVSILFDDFGDAMHDIPKPIVIRGSITQETLIIDIALVGWAGVFAEEACEAMLVALRQGIALAQGIRQRAPVHVREAGIGRTEGIAIPPATQNATMMFRTPVTIRIGKELRAPPSAIVRSTIRRTIALARWQGLDLQVDQEKLHHAIDSLTFDERELQVHRWSRRSLKSGATAIPMAGMIGNLRLRGELASLLPFLTITSETNTGSHAALGLGWFDLIGY